LKAGEFAGLHLVCDQDSARALTIKTPRTSLPPPSDDQLVFCPKTSAALALFGHDLALLDPIVASRAEMPGSTDSSFSPASNREAVFFEA
jgi:hypothetical protein